MINALHYVLLTFFSCTNTPNSTSRGILIVLDNKGKKKKVKNCKKRGRKDHFKKKQTTTQQNNFILSISSDTFVDYQEQLPIPSTPISPSHPTHLELLLHTRVFVRLFLSLCVCANWTNLEHFCFIRFEIVDSLSLSLSPLCVTTQHFFFF